MHAVGWTMCKASVYAGLLVSVQDAWGFGCVSEQDLSLQVFFLPGPACAMHAALGVDCWPCLSADRCCDA